MSKRESGGFERFESACKDCTETIVEFRPKGAMHRALRTLCADCLAQRYDVKIVKTVAAPPGPADEVIH